MLPSVPRLYLNNFFVPGPQYYFQDIFFFSVVVYQVVVLFSAYRKADQRMRARLGYFLIALIYAYITSLSAEFLLYDIPVDPFFASLAGLYTIPMAYAIIKYDMIPLNLFARRAFGVALAVGGLTFALLFLGYTNDIVTQLIPEFPRWIIPLFLSIIAVAIGWFFWKKIKEVDVLKYQFVDVVTHKFRTPLTYINWSLDTLKHSDDPAERMRAVDTIREAHTRLYQLTDALVGLSDSEAISFMYSLAPHQLPELISDVMGSVSERARERGVVFISDFPAQLPSVSVDRSKIQFVIQMLIENAITYSPEKSTVTLSAKADTDFVVLSVRDTGIGMSHEDLQHLFSKFFRTKDATKAHTEGLGIGLYLSRDIARRHGGELWADSPGPGQGSTFFLKIPISKVE